MFDYSFHNKITSITLHLIVKSQSKDKFLACLEIWASYYSTYLKINYWK